MRFKHRPVHAFEDATQNFEQLEAKRVLDASYGIASAAGNGTKESNSVDVPHGLGSAPSAVILTAIGGSLLQVFCPRWDRTASNATSFRVWVESDINFNITVSFAWIAIP